MAHLSGDASLQKRPMGPLLEALTSLGARGSSVSGDGRPPIEVEGVLRGGRVSLSGSISSQFLSSLLIACPLAANPSEIRVLPPRRSEPYVEVTRQMVRAFGVEIVVDEDAYLVPGGRTYHPTDVDIPGDFSSAAFPLVAAAITGGDVTVEGLDLGSPQGDRRIAQLLEMFGARVDLVEDRMRVRSGDLTGQTVDVSNTPDLFPILAVLATQANGETRFVNGDHLRVKESDRIASTVAMLRALGARAEPTPDGCVVHGPASLHGTILTGTLFAPIMRQLVGRLNERFRTRLRVGAVANDYFGSEIVVAGLMTGACVLKARAQVEGEFVVMPTHCDLPPPWGEDLTREGQARLIDGLRVGLVAPLLGLAGLAVPVGAHGTLRTGVQILPGRFREDLALDAGEVIEAAEGVVAPIDPAW